MKKLNYTDESTFITETIEFDDKQYEIAENLHGLYKSEFIFKCSPIMVGKDKKSLIFCVNLGDKDKNMVAYERGDNVYRIVIEKVNFK